MDTSLDNGSVSDNSDICDYLPPPMTDFRFWLVTVIGSIISFISIFNNILLFYVFSSKKHHRTNHNMYMMLLAFFDIFVSVAYICLMSVNVLSDYLQSPTLVQIWYFYMVPMITISHIAMTSSSFLIVAASYERYCLTLNTKGRAFAQRNRKLIAALAIFLGVISKGSMAMEFELYEVPECAGLMTATQMGYREFVFDTPYNVVWRFWYRNFVTIFAPFFILAYLNIRIVKALTEHTKSLTGLTVCRLAGNAVMEQAQRKMSENPDLDPVRRKANARAATRTLVMVVCCYLISNIINVILTIWEHLDKNTLLQDYINFYAIAVDSVSLLTTLACACRLPIYMVAQAALRAEVKDIIYNLIQFLKRKSVDENYKISHDVRPSIAQSRTTDETSFDGKEMEAGLSPVLPMSSTVRPYGWAIPLNSSESKSPIELRSIKSVPQEDQDMLLDDKDDPTEPMSQIQLKLNAYETLL